METCPRRSGVRVRRFDRAELRGAFGGIIPLMSPNSSSLPCGCAPVVRFDGTQSSLVFINACFGIAFAGVFTLIQDYFQTTSTNSPIPPMGAETGSPALVPAVVAATLQVRPAERSLDLTLFFATLLWAILATYVIVTVWHQYSSYYIPLQFHSDQQEPFSDEGSTVLITITLALIPIAASRSPGLTPFLLCLLIFANLYKLRRMRSILSHLRDISQATDELRHLARKLRLNLGCLIMVSMIIFALPFQITPGTFSLLTSVAVILLHTLVQPLYRSIYGFRPKGLLYSECVANAFHVARCPKAPKPPK
jgi:hypothetical protein